MRRAAEEDLRRAVRQASHPIENKESIRNMSIVWVTLFLVGLSLVVSVATLLIALRALEKVNRSERAGDERLEILREQQQRLKLTDEDRKSTRLNSSHANISYAVFCLKKKTRSIGSSRSSP